MGAIGAVIMGFFGAVFAVVTLATQRGIGGVALAAPFLLFAALAVAAWRVSREPGPGVVAGPAADKAIMWSSIAEGVGIFLAANLVVNLRHPGLLLPAIPLVVGLHFLPMAWLIPFRPFYLLGGGLLAAAAIGFALGPPLGAEVAGFAAALCLWTAAAMAVLRERRAKRAG